MVERGIRKLLALQRGYKKTPLFVTNHVKYTRLKKDVLEPRRQLVKEVFLNQ
jgi:hypothetical protein